MYGTPVRPGGRGVRSGQRQLRAVQVLRQNDLCYYVTELAFTLYQHVNGDA